MTAREWLNRGYHADERMRNLQDRIAVYRSAAERITSSISGAPGGAAESRVERYAVMIAESEEAWLKELREIGNIRREICEAIASIGDARVQSVLEDRYIHNLPWREIARLNNYDESTVYRLHRKGLEAIDEIIRPD